MLWSGGDKLKNLKIGKESYGEEMNRRAKLQREREKAMAKGDADERRHKEMGT